MRSATIIDDNVQPALATIESFSKFLDTKAEWQRPLLEHLECTSNDERLYEFRSSGESIKFTLFPDGGARDDLGSNRWEIAIGCEILWQYKGPTFELKHGSFRAGSYGIFLARLFLQANTEYYSITIDTDTLRDSPVGQPVSLPRLGSLASDYDLESGIIGFIATLGISFKYLRIKSHQDDAPEIHLLPWTAQMKIHANTLPTGHLGNYSEPTQIVPFIPASKVSLTIIGETIRRRFVQGLRQVASSPPRPCKKLMERNNWSRHTFNSINWDVPGKALDTLGNSAKIFIVKSAHDHLPTRRHMCIIKRAANDKCPACIHFAETDWQILSCPSRSLWRKELLRTLGETLTTHHTQLDLALILIQGIRGALANKRFQMNPNNCEPHLQSSRQFPEQNRMAASSQRSIQQSMESDSGTTHPRRPRNRPRGIVQRPLAPTYLASSLDSPMATMARSQR